MIRGGGDIKQSPSPASRIAEPSAAGYVYATMRAAKWGPTPAERKHLNVFSPPSHLLWPTHIGRGPVHCTVASCMQHLACVLRAVHRCASLWDSISIRTSALNWA